MRTTRLVKTAPLLVVLLLAGYMIAPAGAQTSLRASGAAFGVQLDGPAEIPPTPSVEASAGARGGEETAEDSLVHVPADPLAESFTALVRAGAAPAGTLEAALQSVIEGAADTTVSSWNGRGFAVTEDLVALAQQLRASVIASESVAGCSGGEPVFGSAVSVVGLTLADQPVPIPNPSPNQEILNQGGIRIVLWETNWDPSTGGITDDADGVWTNALRITAPGDIDLTVSHSEADVSCAPEALRPAPPAEPVEVEPSFTG